VDSRAAKFLSVKSFLSGGHFRSSTSFKPMQIPDMFGGFVFSPHGVNTSTALQPVFNR